jgi:hypothetical protein
MVITSMYYARDVDAKDILALTVSYTKLIRRRDIQADTQVL